MHPMPKRILLLSYFYPPDLSAGSFRSAALVKALRIQGGAQLQLDVVTTQPNRYQTFACNADSTESDDGLHIYRVALPAANGGLLGQAWSFLHFAFGAYRFTRDKQYEVVFATSSRLMTAVLGALLSANKGARLYLDIRDIFVETLAGVFNSRMWRPVVWSFALLERWTIRRASVVNLVSPGFLSYFQPKYPRVRFSFFSNGVDSEFSEPVACSQSVCRKEGPLRVLYAGNIGDGQGLHLVVPELAERLQGRAIFQIIGDGRLAEVLRNAITRRQLNNVELLAPLPRNEIKVLYESADVLFLHLNDIEAFKRVLPSKLFEYAASGKPIWAGVAGFCADFIRREVPNAVVFPPCDSVSAIEVFKQLSLVNVNRGQFVARYARENIMREMAGEILSLSQTA